MNDEIKQLLEKYKNEKVVFAEMEKNLVTYQNEKILVQFKKEYFHFIELIETVDDFSEADNFFIKEIENLNSQVKPRFKNRIPLVKMILNNHHNQ